MKKYEYTGETKAFFGRVLKQIRALVKIKPNFDVTINPGDIGGWIEKEDNLSHKGNAWVYGNAQVYGNAWVSGNAQVYGNAWVSGNARVYGNARVCDDAWVCDDTWVYGNAQVYGNTRVYGNAWVSGNAWVYGNARVCDDAWVYGNARVCDDAWVCDDAFISKDEHWFIAGPMGSRNDITTFFRNKAGTIKVRCGCFTGTIDTFLQKVEITHGDSKHAIVYRAAVALAMAQIDVTLVEGKELEDDIRRGKR